MCAMTIRTGAAAAVGTTLGALGALGGLGAGPVPAADAASNGTSAQAEYTAAIKAVGKKGVHFSSTALQNGVHLTVVGDTGSTSGAQTLVVKNGNTTEHMNAVVVGSTGYVTGNAAALHHVIGLTSGQSSKYAGKWLSFPASNTSLGELVSGLLNSQVATELQMSGPFSYGKPTTLQGQHVLTIHGNVATENGNKVPVVLYVPATGTPLPSEEVTNPGSAGGSTAIHGTVSFTNWGENVTQKAPAHAVSLLKLVPASDGGSSTTAPAGG